MHCYVNNGTPSNGLCYFIIYLFVVCIGIYIYSLSLGTIVMRTFFIFVLRIKAIIVDIVSQEMKERSVTLRRFLVRLLSIYLSIESIDAPSATFSYP